MYASAVHPIAPSAPPTSSVAALLVDERDRDVAGVAIPRAELNIVVRFGATADNSVDVYAIGGRQSVHRKVLRRGLRTVMARLHLGTHEAVLGVPASAMAGRIVALEELWGRASTRPLLDRLATARSTPAAAAIVSRAIAERLAIDGGRNVRARLALDAADRLTRANVNAVASDLGVSERHLRRAFHESLGMSPKAFAKLTRFHRALAAAQRGGDTSWAEIAIAAGYYDQAHLIGEFRAIAGVTPRALLGELRMNPAIG